MADARLNVDGQFDTAILDFRKASIERLERLAQFASGYASRPVGDWAGTVPVSIAATVDAARAVASSSSVVAADLFSDNRDQISAALARSSVSVGHLQSSDVDTVVTALNKATGAAFELEVQEMIRAGELAVPYSTASVELADFTNAGSDFRFLDADGNVIGLMNTKASLSHEVVAQHFAANPDVNYVFVTDEAADSAARAGYTVIDGLGGTLPLTGEPVVVRTGTSAQEYRDAFDQFAQEGESGISGWLDSGSVIDNIPVVTAGFLAYRMYKRRKLGAPFAQNKAATIRDAAKSGTAYAVAIGLQGAGVPIPVTLIGSIFSAAAVDGVFQVRDEWGAMAIHEHTLTTRLERLRL